MTGRPYSPAEISRIRQLAADTESWQASAHMITPVEFAVSSRFDRRIRAARASG